MITIQSFAFNYFSVNTYLVYDSTNEAVIIDCGCLNPKEENTVSSYIQANNLVLKHNLCTHLHLDHILGNAFIYKRYGLSPQANKADIDILPSPQEQAKRLGLPLQIESVPVVKTLIDGETIHFGDSELIALSVPGHSPGSLAFYDKTNNVLFSGDALFAGSIGRTDLWGGNMDILLAAIKDKLLTLPGETIVYPGHGPQTTIIAEKRNNPFF